MRRRTFILGASISLASRGDAQQSRRVFRIAIVHPSAPVEDMSEVGSHPYFPTLFRELRRFGYLEGTNLIVERYSGEGRTHNSGWRERSLSEIRT
jgi:putative tryptophan/tyrosine transport system substrate-binding protein